MSREEWHRKPTRREALLFIIKLLERQGRKPSLLTRFVRWLLSHGNH